MTPYEEAVENARKWAVEAEKTPWPSASPNGDTKLVCVSMSLMWSQIAIAEKP